MVIRSVVLPVSTNIRLTFIYLILRVTTKTSVCGCFSGWEVLASNLMIDPFDMVFGGPLSRVWTVFRSVDSRVFFGVAAENHVDGSLCVGTFSLASSLLGDLRFWFQGLLSVSLLVP